MGRQGPAVNVGIRAVFRGDAPACLLPRCAAMGRGTAKRWRGSSAPLNHHLFLRDDVALIRRGQLHGPGPSSISPDQDQRSRRHAVCADQSPVLRQKGVQGLPLRHRHPIDAGTFAGSASGPAVMAGRGSRCGRPAPTEHEQARERCSDRSQLTLRSKSRRRWSLSTASPNLSGRIHDQLGLIGLTPVRQFCM